MIKHNVIKDDYAWHEKTLKLIYIALQLKSWKTKMKLMENWLYILKS